MSSEVLEVFKSEQRFRPGMHIFVNRAYEAFKLPQHTHDAVEISYVTEGTGFQYMNESIVPVKRGDIFLLPEGTSHVYRPSSPDKVGSLGVINCVFRLEALNQWDDLPPAGSLLHQILFIPQTLEQPWLHLSDKNHQFSELFYNLLSEYRQKLPCYEITVQSLFSQLMVMLHRSTLITAAPERQSPKIQEAIQYIKHHYAEDLTLKQVAEYAFLSTSHLQRLFKQATGSPFTSYVQNLRIEKSCDLLKTTSMTVQQIAASVGYHDMKFFYELFRSRTGLTPQEYRRH